MNMITKAAGATIAVTAATLLLAAPAGARVDTATATAKVYPNCKALNSVYRHGVGRVGARDKTKSGDPVTNFKRSNRLYRQNGARDRDKDGVACEKH